MVQRTPEPIAFLELSPTQVACVAALGERLSFQDGEFLVRAGQKDDPSGLLNFKKGRFESLV